MEAFNKIHPFVRDVVLPVFQFLYRTSGPVLAGMLADHLGYARRTVYNWLKELEDAGLARRKREHKGKHWEAVTIVAQ